MKTATYKFKSIAPRRKPTPVDWVKFRTDRSKHLQIKIFKYYCCIQGDISPPERWHYKRTREGDLIYQEEVKAFNLRWKNWFQAYRQELENPESLPEVEGYYPYSI